MVEVNLVKAEGNSIAAGRDITIIVSGRNGEDSVGDVLRLAGDKLNIPALTGSQNHATLSTDQIAGGMVMAAQTGVMEMNGTYQAYFNDTEKLKTAISEAGEAFRTQRFADAHKKYGHLLPEAPGAIIGQMVYDYVVSGYVAYSLDSDMGSLQILLDRCKTDFVSHLDARLKLVFAEAHQEIATRQNTALMLRDNERLLAEIKDEVGEGDIRLMNLEGLHLRRMGERSEHSSRERMSFLDKSKAIFERIDDLMKGDIGAEIRNNWAITLIRSFELLREPEFLSTADEVLNGIDFSKSTLPLNDFLALPKGHNNRGNIRKQRLNLSRDTFWYAEAIAAYGHAERFWTERDTPYEWAMVQKNKADVRCDYMAVFGFSKNTADQALQEIESSLKYRSRERAPYQYERSMAVKNRIEAMSRLN